MTFFYILNCEFLVSILFILWLKLYNFVSEIYLLLFSLCFLIVYNIYVGYKLSLSNEKYTIYRNSVCVCICVS